MEIYKRLRRNYEFAKEYYGERYSEAVRPYVKVLQGVMDENALNSVQAFLKILKDAKRHKDAPVHVMVMLFSAAVFEVAETGEI